MSINGYDGTIEQGEVTVFNREKLNTLLKEQLSSPLEGAKVATQNKLVQGVQGAESKIPAVEQAIIPQKTQGVVQISGKPQQVSSNLAYKETPQVARAIEETAKQVKDPPSTVRKVINSLSEVKTKVIEYVQNEQERVRKLVNRKDIKAQVILPNL